jgi:hypothetical protein
MSVEELMTELKKLDATDKLRAMKSLMDELQPAEDHEIKLNSEYEIWTPYEAFGATKVLREMLESDSENANV